MKLPELSLMRKREWRPRQSCKALLQDFINKGMRGEDDYCLWWSATLPQVAPQRLRRHRWEQLLGSITIEK
ncbi:hypothetical protein [Desulfofustis limnaeus]|uniref:hypothetical protein n=1 Tax=Desulfofustis limnaeus TaxID=2740163 RepID=UPI0024DF5F4B|nr:hypothetical protein [Desulfofustis limnaeus]MDX9895730.1 hypothetical protein [Desulfofustis sp.]